MFHGKAIDHQQKAMLGGHHPGCGGAAQISSLVSLREPHKLPALYTFGDLPTSLNHPL
jgi:hypothetical protein